MQQYGIADPPTKVQGCEGAKLSVSGRVTSYAAPHRQALAAVAGVGGDYPLDFRQLPLGALVEPLVHLDGAEACDVVGVTRGECRAGSFVLVGT